MFEKYKSPIIAAILLLAVSINAYAELKSSSTGTGVGQNQPPPVCVGTGAGATPPGCVVNANSQGFGLVRDLRDKIANGTAGKDDYLNLGITINANVDLDDANTIAYLNEKVGNVVNVGNAAPNSKTPLDLSLSINGAGETSVALWVIYKTAISSSGFPSSGFISTILDDAGVSPTILADVDTSISDLQGDITSAGSLQRPDITATDVEDWITTNSGFGPNTQYSEVVSATQNGWTTQSFRDGSGKGYSSSAADKALYDEAQGSTYTAHCIAQDPSVTSCAELSRSDFVAAKEGSSLLAAKKAKVIAGTLILADLTELSLTVTSLGSNPADWVLDYLETLLDTGNASTRADWQTTLDNFDSVAANAWYIQQIAASTAASGIYAANNAIVSLFENAGVASAVATNLGVTNQQIAANIRNTGWTSPPSTTQMRDFLTLVAGFPANITYADVETAINNGWTAASYRTALGQGYSNSAADKTLWDEAQGSTYTANCIAQDPSATSCAELSRSDFVAAKAGAALFAAKKAKVVAGTLVMADLTELGLTTTALGNNSPIGPPPPWQMDYLETLLDTSSTATRADWQTTIDGFSSSMGGAWYAYQISTSTDTSGLYAPSNANIDLFIDSGVPSSVIANLGITNQQIAANIRNAGWTSPPSETQMRDFLTLAAGFPSSINYANVETAINNGWTVGNYRDAVAQSYGNSADDKSLWDDAIGTDYTPFCQRDLGDTSQDCTDMTRTTFAALQARVGVAVTNGWALSDYNAALLVSNSDWTNSVADNDAFTSCKISTDGAATPAGTCSLTNAQWQAIIANMVTLTWDSSVPSRFIMASNHGPGRDESFKGCNSWWRDHIGAIKSGGTGMDIVYSIDSVPAEFSTLVVDASNGELSYTVTSQNPAAAQNITFRAKAVQNGITYASISRVIPVEAVEKVTTSDTVWRIVHAPGTSSKVVVSRYLRDTGRCPDGYSLATATNERNAGRDLGMNSRGGTWANTWRKPTGHRLDECSATPVACNTAGITDWSHTALVFGQSGSNNCLIYENETRTSVTNLPGGGGSCGSHSVGTSGWCVVSYICKYTGSVAQKVWPAEQQQ